MAAILTTESKTIIKEEMDHIKEEMESFDVEENSLLCTKQEIKPEHKLGKDEDLITYHGRQIMCKKNKMYIDWSCNTKLTKKTYSSKTSVKSVASENTRTLKKAQSDRIADGENSSKSQCYFMSLPEDGPLNSSPDNTDNHYCFVGIKEEKYEFEIISENGFDETAVEDVSHDEVDRRDEDFSCDMNDNVNKALDDHGQEAILDAECIVSRDKSLEVLLSEYVQCDHVLKPSFDKATNPVVPKLPVSYVKHDAEEEPVLDDSDDPNDPSYVPSCDDDSDDTDSIASCDKDRGDRNVKSVDYGRIPNLETVVKMRGTDESDRSMVASEWTRIFLLNYEDTSRGIEQNSHGAVGRPSERSGSYTNVTQRRGDMLSLHMDTVKPFREKGELKGDVLLNDSEGEPISCEQCGKQCSSISELNLHFLMHSGKKLFSCKRCKKQFSARSDLEKHLQTHNWKDPLICTVCHKTFTQLSNLKKHLLTHSGDKPLICTVCRKTFTQHSHLKRHLLTHSGKEPKICTLCSKTFYQIAHLRRHLLTHTGEKPFSCPKCDKQFSQNVHLKDHLLTHTGEKPFLCTECNKRFSQSCHLKEHMRTHTGERPFLCLECNKRFARSSHLKSHQRTHSRRSYACMECNRLFSNSSNLKAHHLLAHSSA